MWKKKTETPNQAGLLYVGSYFSSALKWARSVTTDPNILIISAKYGLLKLNDFISPYNLKMGDPGSVTVEALKKQTYFFNLHDSFVFCLAAKPYAKKLDKTGLVFCCPLAKIRMGYSKRLLKQKRGLLPKWEKWTP